MPGIFFDEFFKIYSPLFSPIFSFYKFLKKLDICSLKTLSSYFHFR